MKNTALFDKSILENGAQHYEDTALTSRQAMVWYGNFVLQWSNQRIADALGLKNSSKEVNQYLSKIAKHMLKDPTIASRSMQGEIQQPPKELEEPATVGIRSIKSEA